MSKEKGKKEKEAKPVQTRLAGFEPTDVVEVREAAEAFADVKDQFVELTKELVKAKDVLHAAMNKHKVKKCQAGELLCEIVPGEEDVRVKRVKVNKDE